jgi:hypothetical protein
MSQTNTKSAKKKKTSDFKTQANERGEKDRRFSAGSAMHQLGSLIESVDKDQFSKSFILQGIDNISIPEKFTEEIDIDKLQKTEEKSKKKTQMQKLDELIKDI